MPKLTKRVVDAAPVRATDYFIWCDEMPGFGVRIYPSGKRGYLAQYKVDGRTRRVKIGLHGVLTVDEAQEGGDRAPGRRRGRAATRRRTAPTRRARRDRCKELCDAVIRRGRQGA